MLDASQLKAQKQEWQEKLKLVPNSKRPGYAHFEATVEILEGAPSDQVLFNFADDWGYNFGGHVVQRWREEERRFVRVHVYID